MTQQHLGKNYAGNPAENYERYFVPAIAAPVADDLVKTAALRKNERVLDVACGTGIVARLASEAVGPGGFVAGLDVNPGMLAVARNTTPPGMTIEWREGSAEEMPFPDSSFDVVLCQMGLQFMPDREAALSEMRRVLVPGGRLIINMPGPTPSAFVILAETLSRVIGPEPAGFVKQIFSLYDTGEIQKLLNGASYRDVSVEDHNESLQLPPAQEFLWQYVHSTPLAAVVAGLDEQRLARIEDDVVAQWKQFVENGSMVVQVNMVTANGRKG